MANPVRVLHLADLHFCREHAEQVAASLDVARCTPCDLYAIAGDLFDHPILATAGSGYTELQEHMRRLASFAPVVMVRGTPSHDAAGAVESLGEIGRRDGHPIIILQPGTPYFLREDGGIEAEEWSAETPVSYGHTARLLIFGIPEPSTIHLAAANESGTNLDDDRVVQDELRKLLIGLRAIRERYTELPCLLVYHGQVRGAKLSGGGAMADGISADDLALVGADYIALGDIHEPQRIYGIPAYYSGSVAPFTWGETHQAGANLVTFDGGGRAKARFDGELAEVGLLPVATSVVRVDFPHPRRKKVDQTAHNGEVAGYQVWMEWTVKPGETVPPTDIVLQKLLSDGALPGSKVTLNILPTETVRAASITEAASLEAKFLTWAELSSLPVPDSALSKIAELETVAKAQGAVPPSGDWRLQRVDIRGAVGFWRRQRKDRVVLDFEAYGPGVIGLLGRNGYGKTTLLENCTPWPTMLTRDGALWSHFRLRDSWRKLWMIEERSRTEYRFELRIKAGGKTGDVTYYIFRRAHGGEWEPYPDINERQAPYVAALDQLFGSLALYVRTAYVAQKPPRGMPDIADATKGERKALLRELAGLQFLQAVSLSARERGKIETEAAATAQAKANLLSAQLAQEPDHKAEQARLQGELPAIHVAIDGLTRRIETDERVRDEAAAGAHANAVRRERIAALTRSLAESARGLSAARASIEEAERSKEAAPKAQGRLDRAKVIETELKEIADEAARIAAERDRINLEYRGALESHQVHERALRKAETELVEALGKAEAKRDRVATQIEALDKELAKPLVGHCTKCGQVLPPEGLAQAQRERDADETKRSDLAKTLAILAEAVASSKMALADKRKDIATLSALPEPALPPLPDVRARSALQVELALLHVDDSEKIVRAAASADAVIAEIAKRQAVLREAEARDQGERERLEAEIDAQADAALDRAEEALATSREILDEKRRELAEVRERILAEERAAQALETKRQELAVAKAQSEEHEREAGEWELLERGIGPDGVQALELDAIAPTVARTANALLEAAYGSRYRLEFRTTRIGGSGKDAKQIEDFLVYVTDAETGEEQEISTLSGGEAVWVKRALYDAFAATRVRSTGLRFLTCFQDEVDGALDPEARVLYMRMLEAAHKEAGRYQTILISHSPEVQQMVRQQIDIAQIGEGAA